MIQTRLNIYNYYIVQTRSQFVLVMTMVMMMKLPYYSDCCFHDKIKACSLCKKKIYIYIFDKSFMC